MQIRAEPQMWEIEGEYECNWCAAVMEVQHQPKETTTVSFLVDSGADVHLIPSECYYSIPYEVRPHLVPAQVCLKTANGSPLQVEGATVLKFRAGNTITRIQVVVSPDVSRPILSVPRLTRRGYRVNIGPTHSEITKDGKSFLTLSNDFQKRCILVTEIIAEDPHEKEGEIHGIETARLKREVERMKRELLSLKTGSNLQDEKEPPLPEWTSKIMSDHIKNNHFPYHPSCEVCVKHKGTAHHLGGHNINVHFDYVEIEGTGKNKDTYYVFVGQGPDCECFYRLVSQKGAVPKDLIIFLSLMKTRYKDKIIVRADREPALIKPLQRVAAKLGMIFDPVPISDPQANGRAERAVRRFREIFGTLREQLELDLEGVSVPLSNSATQWLVRHVEWTCNHRIYREYIVSGRDSEERGMKMTVFENQTGMKERDNQRIKFLERVLVHRKANESKNQRWKMGFFLGCRDRDILIANLDGSIAAYGKYRICPPPPSGRKDLYIRHRNQKLQALSAMKMDGSIDKWEEPDTENIVHPYFSPTSSYWLKEVRPYTKDSSRPKRSREAAGTGGNNDLEFLSENPRPPKMARPQEIIDLDDMTASENGTPEIPLTGADLEGPSNPHQSISAHQSPPQNMFDAPMPSANKREPQEDMDDDDAKRQKVESILCEYKKYICDISTEQLAKASDALHEPSVGTDVKGNRPTSVDEAKQVELRKFEEMGTYVSIDKLDASHRPLSGKWVVKDSPNLDGTKGYKARYVVRGFEQPISAEEENYSPTTSLPLVKSIIGLAYSKNLTLGVIDITSAFLYADISPESKIYVRPPPEWKGPKNHVWSLNKALYGLRQSPALWAQHLNERLGKLNFYPNLVEKCVLKHRDKEVYLCHHVDDILAAGPAGEVEKLVLSLKKDMDCKWKIIGNDPVRFLGRDLYRVKNGYVFTVPTEYFLEGLREFGLDHLPPKPNLIFCFEDENNPKDKNSGENVDTSSSENTDGDIEIYPDNCEVDEIICFSVPLSNYPDTDYQPSKTPALRKPKVKRTKRFPTKPTCDQNDILDSKYQSMYRQLLGKLLWAENPALRTVRIILATKAGKADKISWRNIVNAFLYAVGNPLIQVISPIRFNEPILAGAGIGSMVIHADASWGLPGMMGRKSISGAAIFLRVSASECGWIPITTFARKQSTISLSSMESELTALVVATVEGLGYRNCIRTLFPDTDFENDPKTIFALGTDSSSALALIKRDGASRKSRHLDLRTFFLQDLVRRRAVAPFKLPGAENIGDFFYENITHATAVAIKVTRIFP